MRGIHSPGNVVWWSISNLGSALGFRPRYPRHVYWRVWFSYNVKSQEPSARFAACGNASDLVLAAKKKNLAFKIVHGIVIVTVNARLPWIQLTIIQLFYLNRSLLPFQFDSIRVWKNKYPSIAYTCIYSDGFERSWLIEPSKSHPRFLRNFHPANRRLSGTERQLSISKGILTRCSPERTSSKEMRLYPSRRSSNKSPTCLLACNNDFTHQCTGKSLPCSSVCPTTENKNRQSNRSKQTDWGGQKNN